MCSYEEVEIIFQDATLAHRPMSLWCISHKPSGSLVNDHALFAHVEAGLTGALVGAVLKTNLCVSALSDLFLGEVALVLFSHLGPHHRPGVAFRLTLKHGSVD